ncbi:hypothetical protein Nepgr_007757 [Nepenthes gracilis]|uniref:Uncharacterized protein n=1 Tax=Nepenthes gracilis TaxID=150966 RepID=A0AAD3S7G3_NEPGR|nr:hypothetical protein Nepgr_007757 [Nepenthes gracilis]
MNHAVNGADVEDPPSLLSSWLTLVVELDAVAFSPLLDAVLLVRPIFGMANGSYSLAKMKSGLPAITGVEEAATRGSLHPSDDLCGVG